MVPELICGAKKKDLSRPLLRWLYVQGVPETMVLTCPYTEVLRVPKGALVVETTACLAAEDAGLVAQLLASGVKRILLAETCPGAGGAVGHLETVFPRVARFEEPGRRPGTRRPEVLFLGSIPLPRRMVLGLSVVAKGTLSLGVDEQLRIADSLQILRREGGVRDVPAGLGPAASQEQLGESAARALTAEGCTACGICVNVCAHGALAIFEGEGTAELLYRPASCQGDLQCVSVCPAGALLDGGELPMLSLDPEKVEILAEVPVEFCEKCRARHHEVGQGLCQSCRAREQVGFGATADVKELARRAQAFRRKHGLTLPGA